MMMKFFGSWGQTPYFALILINVFILFHVITGGNGQAFEFSQITLSRPKSAVGATLQASCNATYLELTPFVLDWRINNTVVALFQITDNKVPQLANASHQYDVVFSAPTTTVNTGDTFEVNLKIRNLKKNDDQTAISVTCTNCVQVGILINVEDCTSPTPSNVLVNPPTGVYNTPAYFQCSQNSTLFYSSGTIGNTATKCLASAEWENEKIVQCWSAPTATLSGNNTYCVNDKATFQCNAVGGFPLTDRVEVYINGQNQSLNGNLWTSTLLTSSNNEDIVECRAISKYTSIAEYSHLGRDKKTLTVYYGAESFTVDGDPNSTVCIWYIATPGPQSCYISFSLNPATYTTSLTKDGAIVINDANQMQTSPPTFVFLRNKPTYSDSGVYTLRITNNKFQVDFNFSISFPNEMAQQLLLWFIIGTVCGLVVLPILITLSLYFFLRKQRNETENGTGNTQLELSRIRQDPVSSINEGYVEINHPHQSTYRNIGQNSTIEPSTSNYENFRNNVSVVRDNAGYVELNALDPNLEAGAVVDNGGYETVMEKKDSKKGNENVSFAENSGEYMSPIERSDPLNPPCPWCKQVECNQTIKL